MLFNDYKNSLENFEKFNVLVINMPRHQFGSMNIAFVKQLALILKGIMNSPAEKLTIVKLYYFVHNNIQQRRPKVSDFIYDLFDLNLYEEPEVKTFYNDNTGKARDFRHLVMIMRMWGLLDGDDEVGNKIDYDVCNEFIMLDKGEQEGLRAKMIGMDIIDNPMFITLKFLLERIKNNSLFSYKPAISILKYMNSIHRAVSKFEVSNLFGIIVPDCNSSEELCRNALEIGKQMPDDITKHQNWFFDYMNWKHPDNNYFRYKNSQEPHFKFNSFMLFMKDLDLVEEQPDESYVLSAYAKVILKEDVPVEIVELEKYIYTAEKDHSDKKLSELILSNIKPSLLMQLASDESFIKAMNIRSMERARYGKDGKKQRNRLIAELAKIKANFICQIEPSKQTFKDKKGNNYVESHHILEFNGENGPDIIDNLIVISPFYHSLIHHGCDEELIALYDHIRKNNIITIDLFKKMQDDYKCLDENHILTLLRKNLISKIEYGNLLDYIK